MSLKKLTKYNVYVTLSVFSEWFRQCVFFHTMVWHEKIWDEWSKGLLLSICKKDGFLQADVRIVSGILKILMENVGKYLIILI